MRIGLVVKILPDKKIGFIHADDLRNDVFFHFSVLDQAARKSLVEGDEVEFEINELDKIEKRDLRATLVRRSTRPLTMRLQASDAPHFRSQHHPRARQRRPNWRKANSTTPEEASEPSSNYASDDQVSD